MFVSKSQFFVFVACIAFGGISGCLLSISAIIKFFIKSKIIKIIPDIIAFSIIATAFFYYAYLLKMPNLRIYLIVGVFLGMVLYFKSLHILLAKNAKKLYNIIKEKLIRLKNDRATKRKQRDRRKNTDNRRKSKTSNRGRHGRRGVAVSNSSVNYGLSTNIHKR